MRIRINHLTTFRYEMPARAIIQMMRLTPRDHDGQHVLHWRIEPSLDGRLRAGEDVFGNRTHYFASDGSGDELVVRVTGLVETSDTHGVVRGSVERLPDAIYRRETPLTVADAAIQDFARGAAGGSPDSLDRLHRLLAALHGAVALEPGPAQAMTTPAQAFAARRGVRQDLAHLFIAAARHLGLPARYVWGYLGRESADPETSHAWAEAKVDGLGWVGFDPASGASPGEGHVRVAVGLDHLGAAPIRGSRYGGGVEVLDVTLSVEPTQRQSQA